MPQKRSRSTFTGLAAVLAAGLVIGGFVVSNARQGDDAVSSVAPSATAGVPVGEGAGGRSAASDGGVAVIDRVGPDLPGRRALWPCGSDSRARVASYGTTALGTVVMQCGNAAQGYEHIRVRHTADWEDVLRGHTTSRDWDDAMFTAVHTALTDPQKGLPVDAGDGKVCYAAPVRFDDGSTPSPDGFVKVIVSATTERVITAYPTDESDC